MAKFIRITLLLVVVLAVPATLTACTRSSGAGTAPPTCSQMLDAAIHYARSGSDDINATMDSLSRRCPDEYEVAADYLANSFESTFRMDSCEELLGYGIRRESVTLLEQDGWCTFGDGEQAAVDEWPNGGLGWDHAREYAGTVQRVCGPLMSLRDTADGTFVNVGRDYPAADRFTFVFWDIYLDAVAPGAIICGTGEIYLYDGVVAQMEMWDPGALEIWH